MCRIIIFDICLQMFTFDMYIHACTYTYVGVLTTPSCMCSGGTICEEARYFYIYTHIYERVYICAYMYIYIYTYIYIHMYFFIHVSNTFMYVFIYIYTCIHTHTHTHIHTHHLQGGKVHVYLYRNI